MADRGTQSTDSATGDGPNHTLTYTLTSSITDGIATGTALGEYEIRDTLDPRLTYVGTTVRIDPDGAAGTATPVALVAATDYTVTSAAGGGGTALTVVLTPAGRDRVASANVSNAAATVVTDMTATLGSQAAAGLPTGIVANTAYLVPNAAWAPIGAEAGIASNEVESRYGDVTVRKYDAATGAGTLLPGASFAVYADGNADGSCSTADVSSGTLLVPPTAASSDGTTTIAGLQTSDWFDGATQTTATALTCCLVETTAPAGYALAPAPIAFTIPSATRAVTVDVSNRADSLIARLPATGGAGAV